MKQKIIEILEQEMSGWYDCEEGDRVASRIDELRGENEKEMVDIIIWLANCPYVLDSSTIPKNGINSAPQQVAGTLSLSNIKYEQLCALKRRLLERITRTT